MSEETIRVFGLEDADAARTDRGLFKKPDEFRYGHSDIPIDVFRGRVEKFVAAMGDVIGNLAETVGAYHLDQVQVSVEVSAKGQLSILGTGGELAGKGGLTLTFKKPPSTSSAT